MWVMSDVESNIVAAERVKEYCEMEKEDDWTKDEHTPSRSVTDGITVLIGMGTINSFPVEPDLIATEILTFSSNSSQSKNDSNMTIQWDPTNEKTTPILYTVAIIFMALLVATFAAVRP